MPWTSTGRAIPRRRGGWARLSQEQDWSPEVALSSGGRAARSPITACRAADRLLADLARRSVLSSADDHGTAMVACLCSLGG